LKPYNVGVIWNTRISLCITRWHGSARVF